MGTQEIYMEMIDSGVTNLCIQLTNESFFFFDISTFRRFFQANVKFSMYVMLFVFKVLSNCLKFTIRTDTHIYIRVYCIHQWIIRLKKLVKFNHVSYKIFTSTSDKMMYSTSSKSTKKLKYNISHLDIPAFLLCTGHFNPKNENKFIKCKFSK